MAKSNFLTPYNSMKKKRIPLKYLRKNEERCPACSGYGIIEESDLNNGFDGCDVCEGFGKIEKEFVADGKIQTSTRKSTNNNSESIIKERANG
jgi:DnaJ-class molecular chaperone